MKVSTLILSALFMASLSNAEQLKLDLLTTRSGKDYKAVTVTAKRPDGISILHEAGTARIPYEELPISVRKALGGFVKEEAEAFRKLDEAAQKANEAAHTEAANRAAEAAEPDAAEEPQAVADAKPDAPAKKRAEPKNQDKLFVKKVGYGSASKLEITAQAGSKSLLIVWGSHPTSRFSVAPWQHEKRIISAGSDYSVRAFEEGTLIDAETPRSKSGLGSDTKLR